MTDTLTLTGLVATTPRHIVTSERLSITNFRLASTQRRYDRTEGKWIDGETNWYTVTAFRQLAVNAATSISKGQRVVVTGRLRVREWANGEKTGTNVEVEADALGHDLAWGTSVFTRSVAASQAGASEVSSDVDAPSDRAAVLGDEVDGGPTADAWRADPADAVVPF